MAIHGLDEELMVELRTGKGRTIIGLHLKFFSAKFFNFGFQL